MMNAKVLMRERAGFRGAQLVQIAGRKVPMVNVENRKGQILHSAIDNSLLRKLGWALRSGLEEGLMDFLCWLQEAHNHG